MEWQNIKVKGELRMLKAIFKWMPFYPSLSDEIEIAVYEKQNGEIVAIPNKAVKTPWHGSPQYLIDQEGGAMEKALQRIVLDYTREAKGFVNSDKVRLVNWPRENLQRLKKFK